MKWQHVLLLRCADLDTLARVANNFMSNADFRNVNRFWHQWKRATTLEHKARFITRKVNTKSQLGDSECK